MSPVLSALLSLDTLPKPSLRAENSSLVPLERSVTLKCQGSLRAEIYSLEKKQGIRRINIKNVKPSGMGAEFPIPSVTAKDAGTYYCSYRHSSDWSESSDPLELVVTGLYDPPSLSAQPSPEVASGHNVTLQCQSQGFYDMYTLYKDGEQIKKDTAQPHGKGSQASFLISAVNSSHEGTYQCYSFHSNSPQKWSFPSEPLMLRVTGTSSPSPESRNTWFGLTANISMGVSAFMLLLFLFLLLLLCHRRHSHQARLGNGGREAEVRKTPRSSDPEGTPLEETLYAAVNDDRQTEEARQEVTAAPEREGPQEVTYAQLNLNSLKARAGDPPPSLPEEPSIYAALR